VAAVAAATGVGCVALERQTPTLTLFDIHPTEVARQLTLVEWEFFASIPLIEYLDQRWLKKTKMDDAPCIMRSIDRFNRTCAWIATEVRTRRAARTRGNSIANRVIAHHPPTHPQILMVDDIKQRAATLNRFIVIAEECRALHNYNFVMEVIGGLQSSAIYRLKKTWKVGASRFSLSLSLSLSPE